MHLWSPHRLWTSVIRPEVFLRVDESPFGLHLRGSGVWPPKGPPNHSGVGVISPKLCPGGREACRPGELCGDELVKPKGMKLVRANSKLGKGQCKGTN